MRWLLSFLLLGLLSIVHAVSSSGNKLLVVIDELADKAKYSKYIADLEGMRIAVADGNLGIWTKLIYAIVGRGFSLTFESPKSDKVALFELGERAYDHLLVLPSKSKGMFLQGLGGETCF